MSPPSLVKMVADGGLRGLSFCVVRASSDCRGLIGNPLGGVVFVFLSIDGCCYGMLREEWVDKIFKFINLF